jgi:hypothetical protein
MYQLPFRCGCNLLKLLNKIQRKSKTGCYLKKARIKKSQLLQSFFVFVIIIGASFFITTNSQGLICFPNHQLINAQSSLRPFPAGYIDSPYILPDGSALYFLHSVLSTYDLLHGTQDPKQVTDFLPDHQGKDGPYWWNSDLYVSYRNEDGITWGEPVNLGPQINSIHMEGCAWVNNDQTKIIFQRESITDSSHTGNYISERESINDEWGEPVKLPGELGDYAATDFSNFHLVPSGNLYFGTPNIENRDLYFAANDGQGGWEPAELMPENLLSEIDESQVWVNDQETILFYNRRGEDANTQLLYSLRDSVSSEWEDPINCSLQGFEDPLGYTVWGEPSFYSNKMVYVRFNLATDQWDAEIMEATEYPGYSFRNPVKLTFYYPGISATSSTFDLSSFHPVYSLITVVLGFSIIILVYRKKK